MRVMVEVKRASQEYDLRTFKQQNYMVFEFAGIEVTVPCTEEQLTTAIRECMGVAQTAPAPAPTPAPAPVAVGAREFSYTPEPEEEEPAPEDAVETPALFRAPEPKPVPVPRVVQQQPVAPALRPVARKPVTRQADDAGISQG